MNTFREIINKVKNKLNLFDYTLLIFIMMMSQDRIVIKLAALIFIFVCRFNFKLGLRQNRLPLFYLLIVLVEVLKYLFMQSSYLGNWATLTVSSLYWGFSFLTLHQVKLSIERNGIEKSENTLKVFTYINFAVCISQLIQIMIITHSLNPYAVNLLAPDIRFQDVMFPYGQSSGDQIRGIFYDNHNNAIISQLCFVFFLFNRRYLFALLNFLLITLICFYLITLSTLLVIAVLFFVLKDRKTKYFIVGLSIFICFFYIFITPENISYLTSRIKSSVSSTMNDKDGLVTQNKIIDIKKDSILEPKRIVDKDTAKQIARISETQVIVVDSSYNIDQVSGKKISYFQTFRFLKTKPVYTIFGCGAGMFSSKLANNFSGLFYGPTLLNKNLPAPSYKLFISNHGSLNKYMQKLEIGKHSINNFPNSVYNQLLSEYGLVGLGLFALFYIFYFVKRFRQLSYGLILLPLLLISFNYGYYFESLDITVFFEFLLFLDLRKHIH